MWLWNNFINNLKEMLMEGIINNFRGMFNEVNEKVGDIAGQVGQTPQGWNADIFDMVRGLSETVILPIAGIIMTFILCYELIQMFMEKNNMHDVDTFVFFKWIFKSICAVWILTHTFDIVMGIFEVAQYAVNESAGFITGSLELNLAMWDVLNALNGMSLGELLGLYMESFILSFAMKIMSLCVFIIIYGRMIEIYLTVSVAPIPLSTMVNREWGSIGNNYLKSLFALAFQGFLIMVCVAIYAVLLRTIPTSPNIHAAIWGCAAYTVLLCLTLFRSSSISKSLFGGH